tara:strand:- start:1879 stop:2526 length:648 start_codon:yes stop_codon:yes gene_type:complete
MIKKVIVALTTFSIWNQNETLFVIASMFLIACSASSDDSRLRAKINIENIDFNLDYALLNSDPVQDGAEFSMFYPEGWNMIDSISKVQLAKEVELNTNLIQLKLVNAFQSFSNSICVISKIVSSEIHFEYIPKDYIKILQDQFSTQNIKTSYIEVNDTIIRQFVISNNNIILIKMFINGKFDYQVDYIISKSFFKQEINSVQASIATITNKERNK